MTERWLYRNKTDNLVAAIQVIDYAHHAQHDGKYYSTGHAWTEAAAPADNAVVELLLQTGAKECHATFQGSAGGDAEFFLFEGATFSAAGTAAVPVNHRRSSTKVSTVTATYGPTVTGDGTGLIHQFSPGGTKNAAVGGSTAQRDEIILKANTVYMLRGINRGGSAKAMSMLASWYELSV